MRWSIATVIAVLALPALSVRAAGDDATLFDHPASSRWWISGQANAIDQWHGAFRSPYSGPHSLSSANESALSRVFTLYTGLRVSKSFELLADAESAGGRGISDAFGLAGFTNLDVVRNPSLGSRPYLARLMLHHVIALSADREKNDRGPLSTFETLPARRIEWRAGKLGTVDFFDNNAVGSDSHLQFENWTVDNNGAFDYAADTRGYTIGTMVELHEPLWSVRGGIELMPTVANGIKLDNRVRRARGQNVELEIRRPLLPSHNSTLRVLLYDNLARMGNYREALGERDAAIPDITTTRNDGRSKYGIGFSGEQELTSRVRVFARAGWNDGRNESFAYTEVDRTIEAGGDISDLFRAGNRAGVALVGNRLSDWHRAYLSAGGLGFLLGDGRLSYGPEEIVELYYTARVMRGVFLSGDVQHIVHPGYNRDRGPVTVAGLRLHLEM